MTGLTDEILAIYRQRNLYVTLSTAKAMYRLERRYRHLSVAVLKSDQASVLPPSERL